MTKFKGPCTLRLKFAHFRIRQNSLGTKRHDGRTVKILAMDANTENTEN